MEGRKKKPNNRPKCCPSGVSLWPAIDLCSGFDTVTFGNSRNCINSKEGDNLWWLTSAVCLAVLTEIARELWLRIDAIEMSLRRTGRNNTSAELAKQHADLHVESCLEFSI